MISIKQLVFEKTGQELPAAPAALAAYVPYRHLGQQIAISGQLPLQDGKLMHQGVVGDNMSIEEAVKAAKLCTINILAQLSQAVDDDLGRIMGCLIIRGFVASTPDFKDHPKIINGASEMLSDILGESRGSHARAAVGMASLPLGAPVEIEATFISS
ncbi:MAG: RidA family protein [SAR116 cluster bacterium]|nr:hypothetical protein [Paracoccaceae bacterium]RCL80536.1 MAG: RidA family protein [SAR116 cluster bacterium]HBQ23211.1 hypothetical protein [Alphaproteobacteria bacterium]HCJ61743.1 hypothetical protein [Alphaproteobacteria bacterium]|tara:strand:+ start:1208 stop:1678 length:471 start_codon:yes stop_codon:yes gene_type:complete